ncbi:MAG: MATE family efflux transporter [Oscillospiraceae bacterium]|nr:MATE family efflux transporter [Oscillospiraceae bacterium]
MKLQKYIGDRAFYSRLFAVMIPILVQNVITNFVSLLDNIMVGRVGTEPMSGVAIVNQILFIFNLCIFGGLAGAGIFTAQYFGKGESEGVRQSMRFKFYIAASVVALAEVLLLTSGDRLISLFIHEGEDALDLAATLHCGKQYLSVMLLQLPLFALLNVYSSTLRETGETQLPMRAGIIAVFVNLVFNYILIFGHFGAPKLGVVGAAAATVIARVVECAIIVVYTHTHTKAHPFARGLYSSLRVPGSLAAKIAVTGLPLLINELLWSGGMTTLNQIMSRRGLEVVSAENICAVVSNLFFCAFFAMGTSLSIIVGQLLGAGKLEQAVDENQKLIVFSVALSTAVGLVLALIAPLVPRIYNTTEIVRHLAADMIIVNAVMMPSNAFTNACFFTLRSGGKSLLTFLYDSVYIWVLSVPLTLFLVKGTDLPIIPIYAICYGVDILKCIVGYILVKKRIWVNNLVA